MAFARLSADSDVYVFSFVRGIECCGCQLEKVTSVIFTEFDTLAAHLRGHQAAGHKVPAHLLEPDAYLPADFTGGPYYPDFPA